MPTGIYERKPGVYPRVKKTREHVEKYASAQRGKPRYHVRGRKRLDIKGHWTGINHPNWKGGISKEKWYKRFCKQAWHCNRRTLHKDDHMTITTLQLVYEDNIKKYGSLTCYLCSKHIEFGKDTIEHVFPLSKGGTNLYNNLAISCRSCNSRKIHIIDKKLKTRR